MFDYVLGFIDVFQHLLVCQSLTMWPHCSKYVSAEQFFSVRNTFFRIFWLQS